MIGNRPKFMDSPYFDPIAWRLLPGAPDDVVAEFEEHQAAATEAESAPDFKPLK